MTLGAARPVAAQWRLEAWLGDAWSLPTRVTFFQYGEPAISQIGDWSTRPLHPTVYYSGRLIHWSGHHAWAVEYTHHKIYLDNPVPGVQYFRVTNGVNFFAPERLWAWRGWEYGGGAGPVFVVPVSSIRDEVYNHAHGLIGSQYEFGGGVVQATVAHRLWLFSWLGGVGSLKLSGAYLQPHIYNGHARMINVALHAGYGVSLGKQ